MFRHGFFDWILMKAYKYRFGFKRDLDTLKNNQIFLPTLSQLNDPCEGAFHDQITSDSSGFLHPYFKEDFKNFFEGNRKRGIYSLSKLPNHELMWAYYANSHAGFCIEYDLNELEKIDDFVCKFDIQYCQSFPQVSFGTVFVNNSIEKILRFTVGSKSEAWAHEQELRLVTDSYGLKYISEECVTAIYFGLRMPDFLEEDCKNQISRKDIMQALSNRNIKYYEMYLDIGSYQLKYRQISPNLI